jgi:hypothetical protein
MTALETLSGRLTLPYRRGAEFAAIPLGADAAGATPFAPYDFAEYRARWGQDPTAPFYVIAPRTDVTGDDLILKIDYTFGGAHSATLTIPRATRAGTGFPIPLPSGANATLRLNSLTVAPLLGIAGRDAWDVVALLGTIAKLVWVLSAEKDALARVRQDVRNARFVESAAAAGLDALGKDMRVPRFPPRPYSYDENTVALWHLDEVPNGGPVTTVIDQTTRPGSAGHPGTVVGAIAGAPGKFATGFAFGSTLITNGPTAAANATLHFATVPGTILPGMVIVDLTTAAAIPAGTTVVSTTATTVVMSQNAAGAGVGSGDVIQFGSAITIAPSPEFDIAANADVTIEAFVAPDPDPITLNASGPTAAADATLHFAAVPGTIVPGMVIVDLTTVAAIPSGSTVVSTTATAVVMSQNATGAGVRSGDAIQFTSSIPRTVIVRRSTETATGSTNTPGWSLCVINTRERGFNGNVLFALCDGAHEVRLFADMSVADGRFHHLAGIVDRTRRGARLFVDGVQRATAPIDTLGAITPPDAIRFGSTAAGNALSGTIDEVRISRVARATFHPALGEDDDAYRARLRIFRHWVLPTPANVIAMINTAAPFPSDPAPYVLIEANQPTQVVECPVRIVPAILTEGSAIALDGTTPQDETVAGTPADDPGFDPSLDLITYAHAGVDSTTDPGGARMQAGTGFVLDALVARLATTPGTLVLEHSFDTTGPPTPLHSVGRALRLRHSTLGSDVLGALAHRAGFAYVRNLRPDIAVAVPAGERIAIRSAPAAAPRVDVGSLFDLTVDPPLPSAGIFSWTIITPGPARARLVAHSADLVTLTTNGATAAANATLHFAAVPATILQGMVIVDLTTGAVIPNGATVVSKTATTVVMSQIATGAGVGNGDSIQFSINTPIPSRPRVRLVTDAPGDIAVRVEYGRGGRTRSGTLTLRVDPTTLADGHALDTIGNLDPDPTMIIGSPDAGFDPSYLVTPANPAIDFVAADRRMQVVSRDALDALAALLAARATPGLQVTQAFVAGGAGVESVGRRLVLGHTTLDAGVLAALAARFFDYVARAGASVSAFMRPDTWIEIGDAATTAPLPAEILLGTPLTTIGPTAAANATLHFATVPGTILPGMVIVDLSAAAAIPAGTTVVSTTATTVLMSQPAGAGVGTGDVIQFDTPLNLAVVPSTLLPGIYNWSTRAIGAGAGSFDTLVRPNAHFTSTKPGLLVLALTYVQADPLRAAPYTFEIRLKPALDVPGTFIPKDQYDIIMNLLDAFHPVGVEVRTDHIRKHVREIEQDPTKAFPAYSFPNFRL